MKYFERKMLDWGEQLDGETLETARDIINKFIEVYGKDSKLIIEYDWENVDFLIEVERKETAEEEAARIEKETRQERADRTRYEKLKAKYGWE